IGTTEIATELSYGHGVVWNNIDDAAGGFPLKDPLQVADLIWYCDKATFKCPETIFVRFMVEPKTGLPKHKIILNSALMSDVGSLVPYKTNSHVTLRLKNGICPPITECNLPPKSECGPDYDWKRYCSKDEQCWEGECCSFEVVDGKGVCVTGPCNLSDDDVLNDDDNQYDDNQYDDAISSVNDSDTETSEKDNSFGCGCSII
ncbi:MAG TPA: hypothetical protein PLT70_06040, partial [bacterium]|nr:hypothetical protein [bacterium]